MTIFVIGTLLLVIFIYGFSIVFEFLVVGRVMNNPANGFMASFAASGVFFLIVSLGMFGIGLRSILAPIIATLILILLHLNKYRRLKTRSAQNVKDVFE